MYAEQKSAVAGNHLGNVLVTLSDKRDPIDAGGGNIAFYSTNISSAQDYYPFGPLQPGRNYNAGDYRFGFNGKEIDGEVNGAGNIYDYGARIYNPRLGKFLSIDPISRNYPWYTPYQFAGNTPIQAIDLDGLEDTYYMDVFVHPDGEKMAMFTYYEEDTESDVKLYTIRLHNNEEITTKNVSRRQFYSLAAEYEADDDLHDRSLSEYIEDKIDAVWEWEKNRGTQSEQGATDKVKGSKHGKYGEDVPQIPIWGDKQNTSDRKRTEEKIDTIDENKIEVTIKRQGYKGKKWIYKREKFEINTKTGDTVKHTVEIDKEI